MRARRDDMAMACIAPLGEAIEISLAPRSRRLPASSSRAIGRMREKLNERPMGDTACATRVAVERRIYRRRREAGVSIIIHRRAMAIEATPATPNIVAQLSIVNIGRRA